MYSDAVVGNVLIIWSRLHLIDVSLLIFYNGICPLIKVISVIITVEPVSLVDLIFASLLVWLRVGFICAYSCVLLLICPLIIVQLPSLSFVLLFVKLLEGSVSFLMK